MTDWCRESDGLELPAEAAAVRDEQVGQALRRLDDRGNLTPQQRATVERLADRLAAALLEMFDSDEVTIGEVDAGEAERGILLCPD
jgi:hypothetical protein